MCSHLYSTALTHYQLRTHTRTLSHFHTVSVTHSHQHSTSLVLSLTHYLTRTLSHLCTISLVHYLTRALSFVLDLTYTLPLALHLTCTLTATHSHTLYIAHRLTVYYLTCNCPLRAITNSPCSTSSSLWDLPTKVVPGTGRVSLERGHRTLSPSRSLTLGPSEFVRPRVPGPVGEGSTSVSTGDESSHPETL